MLKKLAVLFIVLIIFAGCLSACSANSPEAPEAETPGAETEAPPATTLPIANPDPYDLHYMDIIRELDVLFADSSGKIEDIKTERDAEGNPTYSFTFFRGLALCSVGHIEDRVQGVGTIISRADASAVFYNLSEAEQLTYSTILCSFPLQLVLYPDANANFLTSKLLDKTTTSDGILYGSYTDGDWEFVLKVSDTSILVMGKNTRIAPCDHNYWDATCTQPSYCTLCGKIKSKAVGHNYTEATCQTAKTCTRCGETKGGLGAHNYTEATCKKEKTCTVCGATEGSLGTHKYTEATCTTPKTCTVCGMVEGSLGEHEYTDATCISPKTCKVCGKTEGTTSDHDYTAATCTTPKTCKVCGKTEGTTSDHNYTAATCTKPKTCKVCGKTEGTTGEHDYTAATCTKPKTCKACGKTDGSTLGHDYSAATCTAPETCRLCGITRGTVVGHNWIEMTEIVHHEEQGHYEDVQVAKKIKKYRCWFCSYAEPTYETLEAYYTHFDSVHGEEENSSFFRERYETFEDWKYETETKWIVDKPAYSETVVTGHKCSKCGKEK